ncbi:hypothetical protein MACH24_29220 [Erythrobacter sp. Dej080120_24]|uniref:SRPBCC domain-containing protein n=1 Tax=Erythrobacter sp. Dej080120_24 TaxID=3024837 RepID=UPI0004D524A3|nr:hypothetical protein EH30_10510 [Erythrobacter sp. JL475]BDW83484.1 hypothetical protein MACH24_29220 [Erythrobacter sp. Dej080120_24]
MSHTIRTQIEIDAPKERIWDILVDLDRYHEWNPFITDARGRIAPGATFEVRPRTDSGKRHVFVPQVTDYREHREFTWTGAFYFRWIALGDHTFRLTELENGRVRVDHDERIYGFAAPLLYLLTKEQIMTGFEAMNAALKTRAETIDGSAPQ